MSLITSLIKIDLIKKYSILLIFFFNKLLITSKLISLIHCNILIHQLIDLFIHIISNLSSYNSSITEEDKQQQYQEPSNTQYTPKYNMSTSSFIITTSHTFTIKTITNQLFDFKWL